MRPNFTHPAWSRPGRRCSLTSRNAVVMAYSRSTRVSSMSKRTPRMVPKELEITMTEAALLAAEGANSGQGRILAQDHHGLEQRRGNAAAGDGRANGPEGGTRLDSQVLHQCLLQGSLDVLG